MFVNFETGNEGEQYKAVVSLPTNIKKVGAVKLVGCCQNVDDLVMLDIKEAQTNNGELLTNDDMLNSNFFALPPKTTTQTPLWDSSGEGLRCVGFTPRNMPTLTFQLKGSSNNPLLQTTDATKTCQLWLRILTDCDD